MPWSWRPWTHCSGMHIEDLPFYTFYFICISTVSSLPHRPLRGGGSPSWKGRDYSFLPGRGTLSPGPGPTDQGSRGLHGRARASSRRLVRRRPLGCPVALGPVDHQENDEQRSPEGVCVADRGRPGLGGAGGVESRDQGTWFKALRRSLGL